MRKEMTSKSNPVGRMPVRRSNFFSPWFDDFFEPTKWFEEFPVRGMSPFFTENRFLSPAIDIEETDNDYIVSADLPGIKKEDISIECTGNQLILTAERKSEAVEGRRSDRRERYYGTYQRRFTLPAGADAEKIEAAYEGGVLTVWIPKIEQSKARRIPIGEARAQNQESNNSIKS